MHRVSSSTTDQSFTESSSKDSSSINELSLGSTEFQPPLFKLVKRSKWGKLQRILKQPKNIQKCQERDETGLTLLGVAIGYDAPLEIIELIVTVDPSQLTAVDMFGANSLHIACLNGVAPPVVKFLLAQDNSLASSRDKDNRSPMHHATECICRDEIDFDEGLHIIQILCRYNCLMIHVLDDNSNSPLDLVHIARCCEGIDSSENERLEKLTRHLRRLSFKVYKLKKKSWEDKIPLKGSAGKSLFTSSTKSSSVGSRSRSQCRTMDDL